MRPGITNYLQNIRPQRSALDSAMLQRSLGNTGLGVIKHQDAVGGLGGNVPAPSGDGISNAGLFGTSGSLPTNPGPIDPPILTEGGNYSPGPQPSGDFWTHLDPGMGHLDPSLNINPGDGGSNPVHAGPTGGPTGGISFGPGGQLQGGYNGGPQGSVYGIDPNTGSPIYNVTGSPAPGFFDSKTGQFVEGVGSAGLNAVFPGLGSASRWLLDQIRKGNTARNTGTDLSGNAPTSATPQTPGGPAWFQRGYQPPAGIQGAIARGDYQTAYGASPSSIETGKIMASQSYGGAPNYTGTTSDAGHTIFGAGSQFAGQAADGVVTPLAKSSFGPGPAGLQPWVTPTQSEAWGQGLTQTSAGSAQRNNDWLMNHNQANNAILAAWRQRQQFGANVSPSPAVGPVQGGG